MSALEPLSKSYEAYEKSFKVFLDRSTVRQAIITCVHQGTKEALEKIGPNVDVNKPFNVLGIGSGKGEMDLLMLKVIAEQLTLGKKRKLSIHNVIVEPSSVFLSKFQQAAMSLPPSLTEAADISFEWRQETFQDYSKETAAAGKIKDLPTDFDYIHFVHSIYYMDAEETLRVCIQQQLAPNRAIFCLVQTERSCLFQLNNAFKEIFHDDSAGVKFYNNTELETIAKNNGWLYSVKKQQFVLDVSICFGESTEEGEQLIDVLSHHNNFRATADQEKFNSFMEYLESIVHVDDKGGKFVKGEMAAVVIFN